MNGRKFGLMLALVALAVMLVASTPDQSDAHGFFRGGGRQNIGVGGCYGSGSNFRFQNFGFSRSYVAPLNLGIGSCGANYSYGYSAPIVAQYVTPQPVYVAPQPVVAQYVAPQAYSYQQYSQAATAPGCVCNCAPTVYAGQPGAAVGGGGFNPYNPGGNLQAPTPAPLPAVAPPQTYYGANGAPQVAKSKYAVFFR